MTAQDAKTVSDEIEKGANFIKRLLKQVGFIPCSRSHDCYFNIAMSSDCAVSNI